ncbi:hypothetical protein HII31_07066 [Pseudocercospora fuligena]|uniref:CFEM domain-containing protein n=1 Tax=Pseudocercospora fuligena TaxID=685502 RepID=A0A8H6VKN1_9PEZI|nr:hypothetical protein HII31_07066 [Pseudocercospora fuligena]
MVLLIDTMLLKMRALESSLSSILQQLSPSFSAMKLWGTLYIFTAVLSFLNIADAQDTGSELSGCANRCMISEFPKSGCSSPEDTTCICASKDYETAVTACLQAGCTVRQSLAVKKYLTNKCDIPVRNEGGTPRGASWALFAFALFFVTGRFVFRASGSSYGIDDWTALFSTGVLLPINILVNLMVNEGLGQDIWMLEPIQITDILKYFFIAEFLYVWLMGATKISVLLLYLRIWQPPETGISKFRVQCWVLIAVMLLFVTVYSVLLGTVCSPIEYMWWRWDQPREGSCLDTVAQLYSIAAINLSLDFIVCCLPLPK